MTVGKNVIQVTTILKNGLPATTGTPSFLLKGAFNGKSAFFGLGEDVISKHTMLVGSTGCGNKKCHEQ